MPSAIPAGTQPAMTSLAKSGPDRSVANGLASRGQPLARTAVPITLNSTAPAVKLSAGISLTCSAAPTMPWPPRSAHSPVIRSIAVRRPAYSARAIRAAGPPPRRLGRRDARRMTHSGPWAADSCSGAQVVDGGSEYLADRLEPDAPDRGEAAG